MKVGIMQPYFFPYIGYWQLLNVVEKFVIYDDVNFINRGWINRNRILIQDKPTFINLIMNEASQNKLIAEVQVSNDQRWKDKLLKTLELTYKKAPYFDLAFPLIKEIISYDEENLALFLENSIKTISKYLGINTEIILSSQIKKNNKLKGQDKIIEICKKLGGKEYYNPIGGVELYSAAKFEAEGLLLKFLETQLIEYKQFKHVVVPNLSIIDVMMFNSKNEIRNMLDLYYLR